MRRERRLRQQKAGGALPSAVARVPKIAATPNRISGTSRGAHDQPPDASVLCRAPTLSVVKVSKFREWLAPPAPLHSNLSGAQVHMIASSRS